MCSGDYHTASCYTIGAPSMPSIDSSASSYGTDAPNRAFYSSRETASDSNNSQTYDAG